VFAGEEFDHCDRARGPASLPIDPTKHKRLSLRFRDSGIDGTLEPKRSTDTDAQAMIDVLNLNAPQLADARMGAREFARDSLRKNPSDSQLKRLWQLATTEPELCDQAPTIVRYLATKFRQRRLPLPSPPP
jgi:hypothetical protein